MPSKEAPLSVQYLIKKRVNCVKSFIRNKIVYVRTSYLLSFRNFLQHCNMLISVHIIKKKTKHEFRDEKQIIPFYLDHLLYIKKDSKNYKLVPQQVTRAMSGGQ